MRRTLAALSVCGIAAFGAVELAASASADEIPGAITTLKSSGDVTVGRVFRLDATWAVPDNSKAGDTFELALPSQLSALTRDFDLLNDAGDTVATGHAEGGKVTVTLGDFVTTHPLNVHGNLHVDVRVAPGTPADTPVDISYGDGKTLEVTPKGVGRPARSSSTKYGWPTSKGENGWTIEVPGTKTNTVVEDTPSDQSIDCSSVQLLLGTKADGAGYPTSFSPVPITGAITEECTPTSLTLHLGDVAAEQVYRITYKSTIDAGKNSASNHYTVTADGGAEDGTAEGRRYGASGDGTGDEAPVTPPTTPVPTEQPSHPAQPSTPAPSTHSATSPMPTGTAGTGHEGPGESTSAAPVVGGAGSGPSPQSAVAVTHRAQPPAATGHRSLPRTGAEVLPLAALGGGLVIAGAGALLVARRRS